jgi:hypothetical protein
MAFQNVDILTVPFKQCTFFFITIQNTTVQGRLGLDAYTFYFDYLLGISAESCLAQTEQEMLPVWTEVFVFFIRITANKAEQ